MTADDSPIESQQISRTLGSTGSLNADDAATGSSEGVDGHSQLRRWNQKMGQLLLLRCECNHPSPLRTPADVHLLVAGKC